MNWEAELPLLVGRVDDHGDWDDVVRRATNLTRSSRRRRVTLGAAMVLVAAFLVSPAFGIGNWYDALFGNATPSPLVVHRLIGGDCQLEQAGQAVATVPCAGPQLAPTSASPLSDFSRYRPTSGSQRRVLRLAGAAAPGVAAVALLTTSGQLVAKTPVQNGFYARISGLPSDHVEAVVALDRAGQPLACLPRTAPHCPARPSPSSSRKGG